ELQEDAVLVAALVVLPGGVQEPWSPAERGLQPCSASQLRTQQRHRSVIQPVEVRLDGEVAILRGTGQEHAQRVAHAARPGAEPVTGGMHLDGPVDEGGCNGGATTRSVQ